MTCPHSLIAPEKVPSAQKSSFYKKSIQLLTQPQVWFASSLPPFSVSKMLIFSLEGAVISSKFARKQIVFISNLAILTSHIPGRCKFFLR